MKAVKNLSKIFVTGDKHGAEYVMEDMGLRNFPRGPSLNKGDTVVFLGDFGLLWDRPTTKQDKECLEWLSEMPWTSLILDGNHENFDSLDALPEEEQFGNPVGVFAPHVYHLKRGYIYNIGGKKCFVFGGAASPDINRRTPGMDWWSRELPSREETEKGFKTLEDCGWSVDYVFTHMAPARALDVLKETRPSIFPSAYTNFKDPIGDYFDIFAEHLSFHSWHFGHFHYGSPFFEAGAAGLFRGEYRRVRLLPDSPRQT